MQAVPLLWLVLWRRLVSQVVARQALRVSVVVFRALRLSYPAEKGAWTSLFCAAGPTMTAQQSGGYFELFGRLGEPWWLSAHAKDEKLAARLDEWTREAMKQWL